LWCTLAAIEACFEGNTEPHDPERLIELAASMLDQLVDNPCVLYEGKLNHVEMCLEHFYQVACETNTIYPIIRRFLEICPMERVVITLICLEVNALNK